MPGLDPGIQFLTYRPKDWIAGVKPGNNPVEGGSI